MVARHIQHTTKYYNKYVLNDHTELSYLYGSISSKNLSPSLPSKYNNREHFNGAVTILAHIAILVSMSTIWVSRTGNVMDFTLFYVFLLVINATTLCIYPCCYVSNFSVLCIMIEWFIQTQSNALCYRNFVFNVCRYEVWNT